MTLITLICNKNLEKQQRQLMLIEELKELIKLFMNKEDLYQSLKIVKDKSKQISDSEQQSQIYQIFNSMLFNIEDKRGPQTPFTNFYQPLITGASIKKHCCIHSIYQLFSHIMRNKSYDLVQKELNIKEILVNNTIESQNQRPEQIYA